MDQANVTLTFDQKNPDVHADLEANCHFTHHGLKKDTVYFWPRCIKL